MTMTAILVIVFGFFVMFLGIAALTTLYFWPRDVAREIARDEPRKTEHLS